MKCQLCKRTVHYMNKALEDGPNCLDCDYQLRLELFRRLYTDRKMNNPKDVFDGMKKDSRKIRAKIKSIVKSL